MTRSPRLVLGVLAIVALFAIGGGLAVANGGNHAAATPAAATHGDSGGDSGVTDTEQEPTESDGPPAESADGGTAQNHGSIVSSVARETPPGPEHGTIVSTVARANHGASRHSGDGGSKHSGRDD
jgi:hypothetical protein